MLALVDEGGVGLRVELDAGLGSTRRVVHPPYYPSLNSEFPHGHGTCSYIGI